MASKVKTTEKSTAVTPSKGTAVSTAIKREVTDDVLLQDSGAGYDEANKDSYAIPFLTILQDLSPQVKKLKTGYIPGAKPGEIFNTVTLVREPDIWVIPCYFSQKYIEWVPRNDKDADGKSGFVGSHAANTPLLRTTTKDGSKNVLPNGNHLVDTREHYVLQMNNDGTYTQALIAMKSTGLKISRRWMAQMRAGVIEVKGRIIDPPMYAWCYKLGVVEEANDEGSWYQWTVLDKGRVVDMQGYERAKAFAGMMKDGNVKVNYSDIAGESSPASDSPRDIDNDIDE